MLINIELKKSFIIAQIAIKIVNFQVQSFDVFAQVVSILHDNSAFRTNLLIVIVRLQMLRQLLFCLKFFLAIDNRTGKKFNHRDGVEDCDVIGENSTAAE